MAFADVLSRDTRTKTNLDHAINVLFREKQKVESMLEASKRVKPKNTKAIHEFEKELRALEKAVKILERNNN